MAPETDLAAARAEAARPLEEVAAPLAPAQDAKDVAYRIQVVAASGIKISGELGLDGKGEGTGEHMVGQVLVLGRQDAATVGLRDDDGRFDDDDRSQVLAATTELDGEKHVAGALVEAEYGLVLTDGERKWLAVAVKVTDLDEKVGSIAGLTFAGDPKSWPPAGRELKVIEVIASPSLPGDPGAGPVCFCRGTLIETATGPRAVEAIAVGDLVRTLGGALRPVRWRASRLFEARGDLAPILFRPGALGNARPVRLSPQHRVRVAGWRAELWFGEEAVLVPARHFVDGMRVVVEEGPWVEYHHLLFDRHEIVISEGIETESFHPGVRGLLSLEGPARAELMRLFPELASHGSAGFGPSALPTLRAREAAVLLAA